MIKQQDVIGVRGIADKYGVTQQTAHIWLQRNMFPHAFRLDQKGPWIIPVEDLEGFNPPPQGRPRIETYRKDK